MKRQTMGCEKIFANHLCDKEIYKEPRKYSQNSIIRKQITQCKKFLIDSLSKILMANRHLKYDHH